MESDSIGKGIRPTGLTILSGYQTDDSASNSSCESGDKKSLRPGAPSDPLEYNFNNKRRGIFIIFNIKHFDESTGQPTRDGTDIDAERLEERIQALGFEVQRYDDVNRTKMTGLMYDMAAKDHSDADCFGVAILSHGREGAVFATDGSVPLNILVLPFKGDRAPTLVGKPKLFFIQACRGTKMDDGVDVVDASPTTEDDSVDAVAAADVIMRTVPTEADFLFAYSTTPGYYSWRNNEDGSWFIQALCIILENHGEDMELMHMLTLVNHIVAYDFESCTNEEFTSKKKQMPCIVSMLTKYVYFRPKKQEII